MTLDKVHQIRAAFEEGRIRREEFWVAMQRQHLRLRDYQQLIAGGETASIEIAPEELRVTTSAGVKMVWHPEDLRTAPDVLVNTGSYEPVERDALLGAAAGARTILDVGANIGYYSLHWAQAFPEATVHAFEPVPATFERLARNVELNRMEERVRINRFGLSDAPGTVTIYLPTFSGSSASSMRDLHPEEESQQVEARLSTLDDYVRDRALPSVDLIKIDVEGAELLVLKGGMETIAAQRPLLFMELLRKWSKPFGYHPNDVISMLGELGYLCYTHDEGGLARFGQMTEESVQTNFFFAHPEKHAAWFAASGLQPEA